MCSTQYLPRSLCSQGRAWLNSSAGDATGLGPDLRERRGWPRWRPDRDDRPPETASVDSPRYPDLRDYLSASISTLVTGIDAVDFSIRILSVLKVLQ